MVQNSIKVHNPVAPHGADPWVIRDEETGKYYYCFSGGNGVFVGEIESPVSLTPRNAAKVYTAPEGTMYSKEYWAPELHKIGGRWYIYVAADDGDNFHHRMYVLACTGEKAERKRREGEKRRGKDLLTCGSRCHVSSTSAKPLHVSETIHQNSRMAKYKRFR